MRKILFVLSLLLVMTKSYSQFTITIGNATNVVPGTNATIDVTTTNFQNISSAQFSINYDTLVLEFVNATNFLNTLPGLNTNSLSGPNATNVKKGQITFSWSDPSGGSKTLPNGSRLFSLVFKAIGAKCSASDIVTSDKPTKIEITADFVVIPMTGVKGNVKLTCDGGGGQEPCPDPICANANNLSFIGGKVNGVTGQRVCVPFTVRNFKNVQSGNGSFTWNPAELEYQDTILPVAFKDMAFNATKVATGELGFLWSNLTPDVPLTLPNDSKLIDLCFKVLAVKPDTVCVLLGKSGILFGWATEVNNVTAEVPTCIKYGNVILGDVVKPPVIIKIGDGIVNADGNVCVDVTVENFTDLLSLQLKFTWDNAQLNFVRTDMYNLSGLMVSQFNNSPGLLNLSWNSTTPVTVANGTKIFQICFKYVGPCPGSSAIAFNTSFTEATALVQGAPVTVPSQTVGGTITCGTPPMPPVINCVLGTVTNVLCNGNTNGSVALNITGTKINECVISWNGATATPVINGANNISGLGAGTYSYEVRWTVDNRVLCSGSQVVTQPLPIIVLGTVTNAACGLKGSIDISGTSGGTVPYTYTWTPPSLGNTATPSNLDPGAYSVIVKDVNGCQSLSQSFTVGNTVTPLVVTVTSTNARCNGGSDGTITVNKSGGCAPYTTSGSLTSLKAGTYIITVTDNTGVTATATATITEPSPLTISTPIITDATSGNNGSILLTITGGTTGTPPVYSLTWSGGLPPGTTSSVITTNNVAQGTYSVTVTDANGCTAVRSDIIVKLITGNSIPEIKSASVSANVKCFGDTNGAIAVNFGGTLPVAAQLKLAGQNVGVIQNITSGSTIAFTGLKAGKYTFDLTNLAGTVTSQTIEITQPTKLTLTMDVKCTTKGDSTGVITLDPGSTGVAPYNYSWSTSTETDSKLENLARGIYNVTVTDNNGCTSVISNIDINNCQVTPGEGECYTASKIITPNGDTYNDFFVIKCVEQAPGDLVVYDRWGKIVYSQLDYDNTWSGTDRTGTIALDEGGYIWVLTNRLSQGQREVYKGTVSILRTK